MAANIYQSEIAKRSFQNRFKILIIALTALFMVVLNTNIVNVALPTITRFYNVPVGLSQWVITSYQVINIITPLLFAKLSNYTGKARIFIIGLSIFTINSMLCGISTSLTELIAFRIIQALGGAMISSINLAILMQVFPSYEKGRVMGYFTAIIGFGMLMGPTIGGFLIDSLGWTYIFFVNLPIGAALILPAVKYLKVEEYLNKEYFDYIGAALFMVSIGTFFMVLNVLSNTPVNTFLAAIYSFICIVTFTAFIIQENQVQIPFLNISIFKIKKFTFPNTSLALYFTATFILVFIQPFYFEGVMNLSPGEVGIVAAIMPITMMLSSPVSGKIYDRLKINGRRRIIENYAMVGIAFMGVTYLACGYAFQTANFVLASVTFAVAGICRSVFQGPNNLDIINSLPPEKSALASSITVTTQSFGLAMGTAMGTLLLSTLLVTAGFSGDVVNAGAGLLQSICGIIMYISAAMCFLGTVLSYKPSNQNLN